PGRPGSAGWRTALRLHVCSTAWLTPSLLLLFQRASCRPPCIRGAALQRMSRCRVVLVKSAENSRSTGYHVMVFQVLGKRCEATGHHLCRASGRLIAEPVGSRLGCRIFPVRCRKGLFCQRQGNRPACTC